MGAFPLVGLVRGSGRAAVKADAIVKPSWRSSPPTVKTVSTMGTTVSVVPTVGLPTRPSHTTLSGYVCVCVCVCVCDAKKFRLLKGYADLQELRKEIFVWLIYLIFSWLNWILGSSILFLLDERPPCIVRFVLPQKIR
jgi:hypothetical protein